jgi:hypothetical protein
MGGSVRQICSLTFVDLYGCQVRAATAEVYVRVVKLALGWIRSRPSGALRSDALSSETSGELSLRSVFRDSSKASASVVFEFLQYLRDERSVSASYEVCPDVNGRSTAHRYMRYHTDTLDSTDKPIHLDY